MSEFFALNPALEVLVSATIRNEQTFETFLNACCGSFSSLKLRHYAIDGLLLTCGVARNDFTFVQVDFPAIPEHAQLGPFYPTSTPIQIWRVTKTKTSGDPFAL